VSRNRAALDNTADPRPKRRWLTIGPGIVIALAISALIGSQWIRTEIAARRQRSAPPIVERQVISSSYEETSGPTPEVSFILDRAGKLHLTHAQLTRLAALQSKWQKFYAPKIAAANRAAENTNKYLAKHGSRTPVAQIQDAAGPVIALSGEISSARRSYWDQAVRFLDPGQRVMIQREREADWAAKKAALGHRP
jgi:hypothetical protein